MKLIQETQIKLELNIDPEKELLFVHSKFRIHIEALDKNNDKFFVHFLDWNENHHLVAVVILNNHIMKKLKFMIGLTLSKKNRRNKLRR